MARAMLTSLLHWMALPFGRPTYMLLIALNRFGDFIHKYTPEDRPTSDENALLMGSKAGNG